MCNEDLLLQVLFCLPVKSLIRFKSVSKRWLSLISDPKFCYRYTRLNPKSPILGIYFSYRWTTELRCVSLTQPNQKDIPRLAYMNDGWGDGWGGFESDVPAIRHACNGLFLCYYSYKKPFFVYNATTRTSVILPQHPFPAFNFNDYHDKIESAFLVFDPSKSTHFKVVLFNLIHRIEEIVLHSNDMYKDEIADINCCYEIDVYSSVTRVWERMYFLAPCGNYHIDYIAVCDGTLHWITTKKFHGRFEVDAAKLSFIPMPPESKTMEVEKILYFGECCGHLYLVYIPYFSVKSFNVYELDKDHSSWTVEYNVDMCPLEFWKFSVLCVVKGNEGSDLTLLIGMPGKIVSYNLIKKMFKVVDESPVEYPLRKHYYAFARAFPFMPNLSLV